MKRAALAICLLLSMPALAQSPAQDEALTATEAAELKRLEDIEAQYNRVLGDENADPENPGRRSDSPTDTSDIGWGAIRAVFALGAIVLLAYLLLGKGLPKILKIEQPVAQRRIMQVIDRLPIDQRRSIMIIRIQDEYFLIGAAENNIQLLSKLDADGVGDALEIAQSRMAAEKPSLGKLASLLSRKPK
jgi:flagellar protein FliO/FliZ